MSDADTENILKEDKYEREIRECFQESIENDMKQFAHLKNAETTVYWTTGEFAQIHNMDNPLLLTQRKGIDPISFGYTQYAREYYWGSYRSLSDEYGEILPEGPGLPWLLHESISSDTIGLGEDFKVSMLTGDLFDPSQEDRWLGDNLPKTRGESCFFVCPYRGYGEDIWLRIMMDREQAESVRSNQNHQIHDLLDKKMTDVFWWETRGEWTILNIVLGRWKIERLTDIADWRSEAAWDEIQDYERASSLNDYCDDDNYGDDDNLSQYEQDWADYIEHVIGW